MLHPCICRYRHCILVLITNKKADNLRDCLLFICFVLNSLPLCTVGNVGDFDTFGFELVADAVSFGKVLCLLGILTCLDFCFNLGIYFSALGDDGEFACGGSLLFELFALYCSLFHEIETENIVKAVENLQLGVVVGLVLEYIVKCGDCEGGIEVVVESLHELCFKSGSGFLINDVLSGVESCNFCNELVIGDLGVVKVLPGENKGLAVVALQAEETVDQRIVALFLEEGDGQELALGLGHLTIVGVEMENVHPVVAPLVTEIAFGLCDLIGVMGECVVDTAAVNVEIFTEVLHGDAGALNVPAGITYAPGGIPFESLILELGLGEPENEVVLVALVGIFVNTFANTNIEVVSIKVVEDVVTLELGGVKVDVAAGKICVAGVHELGDYLDILVNAVSCGLDNIGSLDVELAAVGEKGVGIELSYLHDGLVLALCALEHLVLTLVSIGGEVTDVGDVHNALDVVADKAEVLFKNILHDVGTQIAYVGKVVNGGTAGVHLYDVGMIGNEILFSAGGRVIYLHRVTS